MLWIFFISQFTELIPDKWIVSYPMKNLPWLWWVWVACHSPTAGIRIQVQLLKLQVPLVSFHRLSLWNSSPRLQSAAWPWFAAVCPPQITELKWSFHAAKLSFCPRKHRTLNSTSSGCSHKMSLLPEQMLRMKAQVCSTGEHRHGCCRLLRFCSHRIF